MQVIQVTREQAGRGESDASGGTLRRVRLDTLPEHHTYTDDGCEVSPACLRCPLPQCKHDEPGWYLRAQKAERDRTIRRLRSREGATVAQLARRFGLSKRTVFRVLHRARGGALSTAGVG